MGLQLLRGHGEGLQGQQARVKDLVSLFEGGSKALGSSVTDTAFPGRGTFNGGDYLAALGLPSAQSHQRESIPSMVDYATGTQRASRGGGNP